MGTGSGGNNNGTGGNQGVGIGIGTGTGTATVTIPGTNATAYAYNASLVNLIFNPSCGINATFLKANGICISPFPCPYGNFPGGNVTN